MNAYLIPGLKRLEDFVAESFGVTVDDMKKPSRKRTWTEARQFAMWYRKKYTKEHLKSIGKRYGGRDHATVIHAAKTVNNLIETSPEFKEKAQNVLKAIQYLKI